MWQKDIVRRIGGSAMIDDVYIADGDHKNHNFYAAASQAFFAGQNHSGLKLRSLIKLHDLKTTLNGKCVTSAVLNLYEAGGDAGVTVNSYALTSTRANSSATWANQPTINGTVLGTCKTTGEIGNKVVMNMTKFVQELCNGTRSYNYGIMMKSTSETNKKYGKFYGVRFTNAGKRPTLVIQYTDGPTTAASVSASPVYVRRGGTTKVTWAGINSFQLSYIQYRVQKSGQTDNLVNYSANTKIGTTSSGSANIKLGDWTDGTYYIYVRGVDKGGIKGVAKGVKVIVDSTAPAFEKASITPVTTETSYGAVYPTASWKVTEPNFRDLYYSMDQGATWKKLSTAKEGSAAIPASEFTKEGAYRIYLRAFDKAGNYKTSAGMNYYYDNTAPTAETVACSKDGGQLVVTMTEISEVIDPGKVYYAVVESGSKVSGKNAYIQAKTYEYKNDRLVVKIPIDSKISADGIYDIYVAVSDKAGNTAYASPIKTSWYNMKDAVFDGTFLLSADKNSETPTDKWKLIWDSGDSSVVDDDGTIVSADIYESRDGGTFKKIGTNTVGSQDISVPEIHEYATYRVVASYKNGKKRLSNILSLQKSTVDAYVNDQEEELEADIPEEDIDQLIAMDALAVNEESVEEISGDVKTAEEMVEEFVYLEEGIDQDADGLLDGYELWELGTDSSSSDSDADGFEDHYEVTVLGTNAALYNDDQDSDKDGLTDSKEMKKGTDPYLPDTDFDGINDAADTEPLKTDTQNGKQISYDVVDHINMYDQKLSMTDSGLTTNYYYNPYSGLNRKIERITKDMGKIVEYSFYKDVNKIGLLRNYGSGHYDVLTSSYDENGEVYFVTYNGIGYSVEKNSEGNLTSVSVDGIKLLENSFSSDGQDKEATIYQTGSLFANGQGECYDYTEISVRDVDGNVSKEKAIKGIKIDGSSKYSYEYTYDSEGNISVLKDNENHVQYMYEYDSDGNVIRITANNGFEMKKERKTDTENKIYSIGNVEHSVEYQEEENDSGKKAISIIDGDIMVEKSCSADVKTESNVLKHKGTIVWEGTKTADCNQTLLNLNGNKKILYDYDVWGNIKSISYLDSSNKQNKENVQYRYNTKGELVNETSSLIGINKKYEYDGNGNRISKKEYDSNGKEIQSSQIVYDAIWRDKIIQYVENGVKKNVSCDALGNPLTWINDLKFTWRNGRTLKTTENKEYMISYKYDVGSLRTKKEVKNKENNVVTIYDYVWDGNALLRETRTTGNNKMVFDYLYDGAYNLVGFMLSGTGLAEKTYIYEKDMLGNVISIYELNKEKTVCVAQYAYDAYGEDIKIINYTDQKIGNLNPYRYRSYYQDVETDLYYLQSRYYDASVGRFINIDNILYLGANADAYNNTYNLFVYCENDPVSYVDSTGYKTTWSVVWKNIKKYVGWTYIDRTTNTQIFYWGYYSPQSLAGYNDLYDRLSGIAGCNLAANKVEEKSGGRYWRIEFWKGAYAYGFMYGGEIGVYYKTQKSGKQYTCSKKYPLKMTYSLYNKNNKRLLTTRTENTWWKNGFALGNQHRNNLRMVAKIYFPTNTSVGRYQMKAFENGKDKLRNTTIYRKGRMYTIIWSNKGNIR